MIKTKKNLLLVVLSTFLALLLALASFGTFSAYAVHITGTSEFPDISKWGKVDTSNGVTLAKESNDRYFYFNMSTIEEPMGYIVDLYGEGTNTVRLIYDFETTETSTTGIGIHMGITPFLEEDSILCDYWVNEKYQYVLVRVPVVYLDDTGRSATKPTQWYTPGISVRESMFDNTPMLLAVYDSSIENSPNDTTTNGGLGPNDTTTNGGLSPNDTDNSPSTGVLVLSGLIVVSGGFIIAGKLIKKRK